MGTCVTCLCGVEAQRLQQGIGRPMHVRFVVRSRVALVDNHLWLAMRTGSAGLEGRGHRDTVRSARAVVRPCGRFAGERGGARLPAPGAKILNAAVRALVGRGGPPRFYDARCGDEQEKGLAGSVLTAVEAGEARSSRWAVSARLFLRQNHGVLDVSLRGRVVACRPDLAELQLSPAVMERSVGPSPRATLREFCSKLSPAAGPCWASARCPWPIP
jgi:hypothetical protein